MKVFLIGGTGYLGRSVVRALLDAGHRPTVLARSAASAARLPDSGVDAVSGSTADVFLLREQAVEADAVVYLAVPGLIGATEDDSRAITAVLDALRGSGKGFLLTSGLAAYQGVEAPVITADTATVGGSPQQAWRVALEEQVLAAAADGVRSAVIRPAVVHGAGSVSGLVTALTRYVAAGGVSFYVGTGANSIPTVHVEDLAQVYLQVLERGPAGASVNVAGGSVLGYDLAVAAAAATGSALTPVSVSIPEAVAAVGPAGASLAMDFKVSGWQLAADYGWAPREKSLLLEMAEGLIPTT